MIAFSEIRDSLLHLLFPHVCNGCGSDRLDKYSRLCLHCIDALPETGFNKYSGNPIEKKFWGRILLHHASAQYYFTKESLIQYLIHQLKYKGNQELGRQLGRLMGESMRTSPLYDHVDALIPLPLFPEREKTRGYNQAKVLCDGISEAMGIPVLNGVVRRSQHTDTQTKKSRIERWQNMEGKFILTSPEQVTNKEVLLIDDIITTGATLEACAMELQKAPNVGLNIATLCYANR